MPKHRIGKVGTSINLERGPTREEKRARAKDLADKRTKAKKRRQRRASGSQSNFKKAFGLTAAEQTEELQGPISSKSAPPQRKKKP